MFYCIIILIVLLFISYYIFKLNKTTKEREKRFEESYEYMKKSFENFKRQFK